MRDQLTAALAAAQNRPAPSTISMPTAVDGSPKWGLNDQEFQDAINRRAAFDEYESTVIYPGKAPRLSTMPFVGPRFVPPTKRGCGRTKRFAMR